MFYSGAKPGDTCFADVVAIDNGIFAVLEKKPISFTDDQVALILRLARGMSQTRRGRHWTRSPAGCHQSQRIATSGWRSSSPPGLSRNDADRGQERHYWRDRYRAGPEPRGSDRGPAWPLDRGYLHKFEFLTLSEAEAESLRPTLAGWALEAGLKPRRAAPIRLPDWAARVPAHRPASLAVFACYPGLLPPTVTPTDAW